jgi:hypothetical protein
MATESAEVEKQYGRQQIEQKYGEKTSNKVRDRTGRT